MKKLVKVITLVLLATSFFAAVPAMCDNVSANELEKALLKYVLSYEALRKAKQTPSQQSKIPMFKKNYDEAYSSYLKLLHDAELYDPSDEEKVNDPAGEYNSTIEAKGGYKQQWQTVDTSSYREKVNTAVMNGKEPSQVVDVVKNQIPSKGFSKNTKQIEEEKKAASTNPDDNPTDNPTENPDGNSDEGTQTFEDPTTGAGETPDGGNEIQEVGAGS